MNVRKNMMARSVALMLALTLALPFGVFAWAGKANDLGGGWVLDTSTAGQLSFKYAGTEMLRATANGIVTPRLALGAVTSALPTYAGCMAQALNAADGNVVGIAQTWSGSPNSNDHLVYANSGGYWSASGTTLRAGNVYVDNYYDAAGTGPIKATKGAWTPSGYGIAIGAASAASVPTTNALDFAAGAATNPAAGIGRIITDSVNAFHFRINAGGGAVKASYLDASTRVRTASVTNEPGTGPPAFTYGLGTNGYGISMSPGTPTAITTAVIEIPIGPTTLSNAASGTSRIGINANTYLTARTSAGNAGIQAGGINCSQIRGTGGNTAVVCDYGVSVSTGYGVTFTGGATPSTPAAGTKTIFNSSGTQMLSVISSDATTRALAVVVPGATVTNYTFPGEVRTTGKVFAASGLRSASITNYTENGSFSADYGITIPADKGITFTGGAAPADPGANKVTLWASTNGLVGYLRGVTSGGASIVATTP